KWGQMVWGGATAVPGLGPWTAMLLGCLLGVVGVLALRSARKLGLVVTLLVLFVPIAALASVPFIFVNGTVADANQINRNFASLIPVVGKTQATANISGTAAPTFVFPSSPAFVAPRDLTCIVTIEPYLATSITNARQFIWSTAIQVGSSQTVGPSPGPG